MNFTGPRIHRSATVLLAIVFISCVDSPSEPLTRTAPPDLRTSQSWISGGEITVVDGDYGLSYTLNIDQRIIARSDGEVMDLTPEEAAMMASAFHGTVVTDAIADDLISCTPESGCFEPMSIVSADGLGGSSIVLWRPDEQNGQAHPGGAYGIKINGHLPRMNRKAVGRNNVSASYWGEPCTDVANAAFATAGNYRTVRTSFLRDVWPEATATVVGGVLRRTIGQTTAGLIFADRAASHAYARVGVGVMAFVWNSYNCGNRTITAGPFLRSSPGGGGGSQYSCHWESWSISFDGGQTSYPISVYVCEYSTSQQ